ncbi:hypothetical protein SAMN05421788_107275 [Filimonas lacunae]|uniref:Uncharacterized protein n=1 Tax=Filimonas lacunae TaxID=477680 RepID=A0A173MG62_9BACT|nr:hypothetical protein [Filimonas lacunae]BAV06614.1 cytochrome c family protein [Filimonas lacunae]SIT27590.1 hypothetical protein SAMN05421788_107275 [Filimonas lacunae]
MKKQLKIAAGVTLLLAGVWACGSNENHSQALTASYKPSSTPLPSDVFAYCTVSPNEFDGWFESGKASVGGKVKHANSVTFPSSNNCDFYKWSEQMFLWLTSPAGNGKLVMETPLFYDVSSEENKERHFIPHVPGQPLQLSSGVNKTGPNGLPVMRSTSGQLFEIEDFQQQPNGKKLVTAANGAAAQVAQVREAPNGKFEFLDAGGKVIQHPKAIIHAGFNKQQIVTRFTAGNKTIYLDAAGNLVDSESGQATGDALLSRNGALVYYLTIVNDVYANYLTFAKQGLINNSRFPTTAATLDSICKLARKSGVTLPDSNALAMEFKSSWVETSTLDDSTGYIRMIARVTKYDTSNPARWLPKGTKTVSVALVGVHVVGSVAGHPELVWATFEHQSNAPNIAYQYQNSKKQLVTAPADTGTGWLFSTNALDTKANVSQAKSKNDTITAASTTIKASNTQQWCPWGTTPGVGNLSNQEDTFTYVSNTKILSINNSIRSLLGKDVRKNYLFIGATWTFGGTAPNGNVYSQQHQEPGVSIGTNTLANSTMETYFQSNTRSCFTCHKTRNAPPSLNPVGISHIFGELKPLKY